MNYFEWQEQHVATSRPKQQPETVEVPDILVTEHDEDDARFQAAFEKEQRR
jgi:hypothetical protein